MWVARDKNGSIRWFETKPSRDWGNYDDYLRNELTVWNDGDIENDEHILPNNFFTELKWEDEPIEVMVEPLEELRKGQIDYKTKQIESLTRVFRGVAFEEVANILNDLEEKIHSKYKMKGNPYCTQNCRMVTIPHSSIQLGDNSLREFIVYGKVVVTIYVRRNDFNTADILVSDLGGEYKFKERI